MLDRGAGAAAVVAQFMEPVLQKGPRRASPLLFSFTVAKACPSMKNVTVPVTRPAPGAAAFTVVVKVTGWPTVEFGFDVVSVCTTLSFFTASVRADDVLPAKLLSPKNLATTWCVPTGRLLRVMLAWPAVLIFTEPMSSGSSRSRNTAPSAPTSIGSPR